MARLSKRSQRRVRELTAWLGGTEPSVEAMPTLLPELHALLGLDSVAAFAYRPEEAKLSVDWLEARGQVNTERAHYYTGRLARRSRRRPGLYDAFCPEPAQRNRVVCIDYNRAVGTERLRAYRRTFRRLGIDESSWERDVGVMEWADHEVFRPMGWRRYHLRALICHGDGLLGWVGGCQDEPATERQRDLLRALVPALRERLHLEESVRDAQLWSAGVDALLNELAGAAFLVSKRGAIRRANAAGKHELTRDRSLCNRVVEAVTGRRRDSELEVTRIEVPGQSTYFLVRRYGADNLRARCDSATARWSLTPRQGTVLLCVARGLTNKAVAGALGISQKTVEHHLTAVFERAGVSNRAELLARLLQLSA